jgi:hypothetical protein
MFVRKTKNPSQLYTIDYYRYICIIDSFRFPFLFFCILSCLSFLFLSLYLCRVWCFLYLRIEVAPPVDFGQTCFILTRPKQTKQQPNMRMYLVDYII